MEIWKILLITLLSAVLLGCVTGVAVGKHQVKKRRPNYRPLLSVKERILYGACILFGAGCIAFGLLYAPPAKDPVPGLDDGMIVIEDGAVEGDVESGGTEVKESGGAAVAYPNPGVRVATREKSVVIMG